MTKARAASKDREPDGSPYPKRCRQKEQNRAVELHRHRASLLGALDGRAAERTLGARDPGGAGKEREQKEKAGKRFHHSR